MMMSLLRHLHPSAKLPRRGQTMTQSTMKSSLTTSFLLLLKTKKGSVASVERAVANSTVNKELVDNEQASPGVFFVDLSLTLLPLVNQSCVFVFLQVRGHF